MGLAERGREGSGKYLEGNQVLLKVGDFDGQLLGADIEGGESFLHLSRTAREPGDVFGELGLKRQPRPPEFEPGQGSGYHGAYEGQQRAQEDQS